MSIFNRLLSRIRGASIPADDPVLRVLGQLTNAVHKDPLSSAGHPVCPHCHFEHPVHAAKMRVARSEDSEGAPLVVQCPECHNDYVPEISAATKAALAAEREILAAQRETNDLIKRGRLNEAANAAARALRLARECLDETHPGFATSLNNLAAVCKLLGDYRKAEPLYREALGIWQRARGDNDDNIATAFSNLGALHRETGSLAEAEAEFRQALELRRRTHGELDPGVARCLASLAQVYERTGRSREAIQARERARTITQQLGK